MKIKILGVLMALASPISAFAHEGHDATGLWHFLQHAAPTLFLIGMIAVGLGMMLTIPKEENGNQ